MCTRQYETVVATTCIARDSGGRTEPTAVANANAQALCPEWNDSDMGMRTQRASGTDRCAGYERITDTDHHRRTPLMQNLRRGHYELAVDTPPHRRVAAPFSELAHAI
jgi:hypothetical protein